MRDWFREGFYGGAAVALVLGIWLAWLWGPEHQVRLHSEHLLRALEQKSWGKFETFIAADYHDQWEQDHDLVLERSTTVFAYTYSLRLEPGPATIAMANGSGTWQARISVQPGQTELGTLIAERVNGLTTPFTLEWHKQSGKPWDWKLVRVSNEGLQLPSGFD